MGGLLPHFLFDSIYDITPDFLIQNGFSAVFADLDDTLGATDQARIDSRTAGWVNGLRARGIRFVVLSNNSEQRVSEFCAPADIEYVADAAKPLTSGVRRALALTGKTARETALVGDQIFTDMLCASFAGMRGIAVRPFGSRAGWWVRFKRVIERPIWRAARKRESK